MKELDHCGEICAYRFEFAIQCTRNLHYTVYFLRGYGTQGARLNIYINAQSLVR
jgi:hypothetical protein